MLWLVFGYIVKIVPQEANTCAIALQLVYQVSFIEICSIKFVWKFLASGYGFFPSEITG